MSRRYPAAILTASYNGLQVPNAPTIGTATAGAGSASVTFTAPANVGGGAITSYTVISSPGAITGTGASSPITVSGLTNGTAYTFTVVATNAYGSGPASAASNSVTPAVNYIESVFSTYLYTGTGASQTITNGIDLSGKGGLVWTKARNLGDNHILIDTVRGVNNAISSNLSNAQFTYSNTVTAFSSTGFTAGTTYNGYNVATWTFREQPKFFDIVTFTTTGSNPNTGNISHNLGSTPACVMVKSTSGAQDWKVYHIGIEGGGILAKNRYLQLNDTSTSIGSTNWINVSSTTISFPGGALDSGVDFVAYLFAHDAGGFGLSGTDNVISCGSFTTDGSGRATVTLGYEPQWILTKRTDSSSVGQWFIIDNMRGFAQTYEAFLQAQSIASEGTTGQDTYPTATGFQTTGQYTTIGNGTFIYIAIRRGPMAVPTVGTSVFAPISQALTSNGVITTNFPVDFVIDANRPRDFNGNYAWDRLRGSSQTAGRLLFTQTTDAEYSITTGGIGFDRSTGIVDSYTGNSYPAITSQQIYWNFRRAPGFMDVVCYTGTGVASTVTHNLAAVPELMIMKNRSTTGGWYTYSAALGASNALQLNLTNGALGFGYWNNTSPTSSVFSTGAGSNNDSGVTYVAYLFATCAGVSKVGSYTGTGALQTINCAFTTGARYVLIKRTDSTGDWFTYDSARGITSGNDPYLLLNSTAAEVTGTNYVDSTAAGFQVTAAAPAGLNAVGGTYIFLAIA